jgi:hypothetical protein
MFLVFIGFVVIAITSCTGFKVSELEVHQTPTEGEVVGDFNIKVGITKFLGVSGGMNLFNITSGKTDPAIVQAIRAEIQNQGGTAAINVKIENKVSFGKWLLNGITFAIYAPATAHVTGTIIK